MVSLECVFAGSQDIGCQISEYGLSFVRFNLQKTVLSLWHMSCLSCLLAFIQTFYENKLPWDGY